MTDQDRLDMLLIGTKTCVKAALMLDFAFTEYAKSQLVTQELRTRAMQLADIAESVDQEEWTEERLQRVRDNLYTYFGFHIEATPAGGGND